jgi:hypothetical protein
MGRPCGTNGPAQIGTCYISEGRKNRKTENRGDLRPDGKTRSRDQNSGHKQPKTGVNGVDTKFIKTNATNYADISRKWLRQCI